MMSYQIENICKEIKIVTKELNSNSGVKNTITQMKNSSERLNTRFKLAEESVNLKIGQLRLSRLRNRRKKEWRKMNSVREMWDTIKHSNICIMEVP